MLTGPKLKALQELLSSSTKEEIAWINGYLAGLVANGNGHAPAIANGNGHDKIVAAKKISLVYGTETGNAKKLATNLAGVAKRKGIAGTVISIARRRTKSQRNQADDRSAAELCRIPRIPQISYDKPLFHL